ASPAGWRRDPGLVCQFYSEQRREARRAHPNPAHYALAELARKKGGFVALSQNVAPELHSGIRKSELPQCPECKEHLLRPRVVWFGESLPEDIVADVDALFEEEKIDLCLVIGTSSKVWPTAGFCDRARKLGAKVAWVNMRADDVKSPREDDWIFLGDAAVVVPEILGLVEQS
ncbi:DHS-like NAD/FAD-binding domain-containing protein, partial [Echria macrotheca]